MSNFFKVDLTKKPRVEQDQALNFIKESLKNKDSKFILLDLPTGVGKSLLSIMFMDYYINNINKGAKFDMLVSSKILQTQYTQEFKSITSLWGRENYHCEQYSVDCSEGKKFCQINKTTCENCPYDVQKGKYLNNIVSLTNFHLYTILQLYQEELVSQRESNVLIVDEAHEIESIINSFLSINLNEFWLKKNKFTKSDAIIKEIKRIFSLEDFVQFWEEFFLSQLNQTRGELSSSLAGISSLSLKRSEKFSKASGESKPKILEILSELEQFKSKVESFIKDYKQNPENWVFEKSDKKGSNISISPVWSGEYLEKYIWSKYDHIVLMSGTILNKKLFCFLNGIDESKSVYLNIDSPFDAKNRPIYYMPLGKLTYTLKEETFKNYIPFLNKILNKYKDKKGIIHTVTYEFSEWVKRDVKSDRFIFHDSDSKDYALRKHYLDEKEPTVIVSPSMGTGVDFEGERARFQVLLKVPYPYLGSEKNKIRQKLKPEYYTYQTISALIQAYGRGVRNYDDYCDFIILDGCFNDLMKYSSEWFPNWVWNAIKKINVNKQDS